MKFSLEQPKFEQSEEIRKKAEKEENKEKNKDKELLFEIRKRIGKFDVSVGIERGKEPMKANIDLIDKQANLRVTPEGVRKCIESINRFCKDPENVKKVDSFLNKWEEWLEKKKQERAKKTIGNYAKQEGQEEAEIIEDFLEEFKSEKE